MWEGPYILERADESKIDSQLGKMSMKMSNDVAGFQYTAITISVKTDLSLCKVGKNIDAPLTDSVKNQRVLLCADSTLQQYDHSDAVCPRTDKYSRHLTKILVNHSQAIASFFAIR